MNSFYTKFAVNTAKPEAEVQLIDGQIKIAIGGWAGLTRNEIDHPDIIGSMRKGWIKVQDIEPKGEAAPELPGPEISTVKTVQGTETPPARTKQAAVEGTTSTAIGEPDKTTKTVKK